jgi:flagellar basal body L-ring protein FlgH
MTCSDVADLLQVPVLQYGRYWIRTSDPLLVEQGKEEVKFFGLV